ncbi:hypothetical protein DRQ36_05960 [bacterium]|nr:MAG: hypothetical protein DRQ36_05960 [bacterium]
MAGFFRNIFRTLNEERVKYLVVGGLAVVLHGAPRFTADVDMMVDLTEKNVLKLWKALIKIGYRPRIPVEAKDFADPAKRRSWIEEKNMKVFQFVNPDRPIEGVDIFVENPIDFAEAYSRRKEVQLGDIAIPIASLDDLIYLKKEAARAKDLADIGALEDIKEQNDNE